MCDETAGFYSKYKILGHLFMPIDKHIVSGKSVKGIIDFNRRKNVGKIPQLIIVFQLCWIESALPMLIMPARCPYIYLCIPHVILDKAYTKRTATWSEWLTKI
jgi:hypothetical protein